jgi:hypothetical protein
MNLEEYNSQHKYWKEDHEQVWAEINFNTLTVDLCRAGWTKVVLTPMTTEQSAEVDLWIDCKCAGEYKTMGLVWLFEKEKDAIMFTLVWT